jgi:very-short-patch-repair endonuclease
MGTEEKLDELFEVCVERYETTLQYALSDCDSPIEQIFLLTLMSERWTYGVGTSASEWKRRVWSTEGFTREWRRTDARVHRNDNGPESDRPLDFAVMHFPLLLAKRHMVVDFAFFFGSGLRVAVELDGHDFHERTKEQASKDKSRDRILVAHGWQVLRFTGSEVYADAERCVTEVEALERARRSA